MPHADHVRLSRLDNGIPVLSEETEASCSVTLGIWVRNGSRHEAASHGGISHFLEHLLFKGTTRRSAREIAQAVEDVGGVLNAFTGKENTCFYVKVLPEHVDVALDVLGDIFLHSTMPDEEIERERTVIVQEVLAEEETPDEHVHDLFVANFWGEHPLAKPIAGTADSVSALTRADLVAFRDARYCPERVLIAAAGPVAHEAVIAGLADTLGTLDGPAGVDTLEPPQPRGGVAVADRDLEQAHLCLGVPGIRAADDDRFAVYLLNLALGGGMSSRLFQEVREERGRAYSVYSYLSSFADGGYLGVYVGTSPEWVAEVIDVTRGVFRDVLRNGLRRDEIDRAKSQMKAGLLLGLDSTDNRMSRIARSMLTIGHVPTITEVCGAIDAVSADDIVRVAARIIGTDVLGITVLGRVQQDRLRAEVESA